MKINWKFIALFIGNSIFAPIYSASITILLMIMASGIYAMLHLPAPSQIYLLAIIGWPIGAYYEAKLMGSTLLMKNENTFLRRT